MNSIRKTLLTCRWLLLASLDFRLWKYDRGRFWATARFALLQARNWEGLEDTDD